MYSIPLVEQVELQLRGTQLRFDQLVERVPMLSRLAREQGLSRARSLEDVGVLLVPHTALKSYALSWLENNRYDRLTAWLQAFTAHDLSGVRTGTCETLDDWIDTLDAQTALRIVHSSGTSGKLSFLPRDDVDSQQYLYGYLRQFDSFGGEPSHLGTAPAKAPILYLQYRRGAYAQQRMLDVLQRELFGRDPSMIVSINPGRLSADVLSLGGRLRAAERQRETTRINVSQKLLARRDTFLKEQKDAEVYLERFLVEVGTRFKGMVVSIVGSLPQLYRVSAAGLALGQENMFDAGSAVAGGGGLKGANLPDNWRATITRYVGASQPRLGYGMSELTGITRICPAGHFHLPPWQVPFLLDPTTGRQFPRTGVHTGRYGVFDLNAQSFWAGVLTGDEVTLSWGDAIPCGCGRIGPYLHTNIRRYSEAEGGDDKITCAGAPQAYENALAHIVQTAD